MARGPEPLPSDFFMDYRPYVHEPPVNDAAGSFSESPADFSVEFKAAA
jgi:hypothetical protein